MPPPSEPTTAPAATNGAAVEPALVMSVVDSAAAAPGSPVIEPPSLAAPARVTYRTVFAHKHFRRVLIAQWVSNVGTWMELFAIQMVVSHATHSLRDVGTLALLQTIPIFLMGIFGGLAADRFNRRTMLVVTQVAAALVAAAVAVVSAMTFENPRTIVHWLFALGAVNGMVMAFNFPAWQTLTPRLVPRAQLTRAIALNGIQFNLARVVGPALAGAALAQVAATPLFVFNAISFLGVAMVVMTTPDAPPPKRDGTSLWGQVVAAARFVRFERGPRAVFLAQVYISLLAAPLVRLLSMYVINVYGLAEKDAEPAAGTLLAVQGVGAIVGGVALTWIPAWYPRHHFIPVAVASLGMSICLFALTPSLAAGCAAMVVCGFFWIWAFNQSWAALQVLAPDEMRGRVLSLATVAGFGATGVGALAIGAIGEWLVGRWGLDAAGATHVAFGLLGGPLLIGGVYMLLHRVPEVDGPDRVPPPRKASGRLVDAVLAREHWPGGK